MKPHMHEEVIYTLPATSDILSIDVKAGTDGGFMLQVPEHMYQMYISKEQIRPLFKTLVKYYGYERLLELIGGKA